MRILHYLNQFFAGKGAEEAANLPFDIIEGPVGPGIPLNNLLGDSFNIEYTMTAGDNWASENITEFENNIREQKTNRRNCGNRVMRKCVNCGSKT